MTPSSPRPPSVRLLDEPTAEMRFWARALGDVLDARDDRHPVARIVATALVTPLAHLSNLSLDFQLYLYRIFHRSRAARLTHSLLMPAIVIAMLATASRLHPAAGWILAAALATFYVLQAVVNEAMLLAPVMVALTAALASVASAWASHAGGATPLWSEPALWLVGLSMVQTSSHAAEADVPPRASGSRDWVPIRDYFLAPARGERPVRGLALRLLRSAFVYVAGVFNELTSSWRLLPVDVMRGLFTLGYQPERQAKLDALTDSAIASGNPAIDVIGIGGARLGADELVERAPDTLESPTTVKA